MKAKTFILSLLCCVAATAQQAITPNVLQQLEGATNLKGAERALQNAIQSNSINKMALVPGNPQALDTWFSVEVQNSGISNQESSGRCWLFTGTNVLRQRAMKNLGIEGFMFSHVYTFFYDQLEKKV